MGDPSGHWRLEQGSCAQVCLLERSLGPLGGGEGAEDWETTSIPNTSFQVKVSITIHLPAEMGEGDSLECLYPLGCVFRIMQARVWVGAGPEALSFSALGQLHSRLAFKLLAHSRHNASGPGRELGLPDPA